MLMNNLLLSDHFREWLSSLKDQRVKARILSRIRMAELGNFGDFASVGGGVLEMRVHEGPGYRVYYVRKGETVYLLLAGGDKSTQRRDIKSTIATWDEIRKEN
jgi:putative addiction module killer protein